MKVIHILHHSISPFAGQYPDGDPLHYNTGFPMRYARAMRARYPDIDLECWRPEKTCRRVYVWKEDEEQITHRVFPSLYGSYNLEYSHSMMRALREESTRPDTRFLVHGSYNLHAYLLALILSGAPVILQSHGGFPGDVLFHRSRHRWLRSLYLINSLLERVTLPRYKHILAISREERAYLARLCHESTVHFSPTGIDFDSFSPGDRQAARNYCGIAENERLLLYVGRLSSEKGLDILLQAFALVIRSLDPMPRLVIAGSGPLREALMEQVHTLGVSTAVDFLGNVPHEQLPHWYRAADLTVIPSLLEWFGAVAVESLASGTPIVGTEAGGLVDIVAEFECGVLVPPRNAKALARAIVETMCGHPLPPPNIERGRAAFDWSVKIAHMMDIWGGIE